MRSLVAVFLILDLLFGYIAPYSLKSFRDILNISKLQAPYSFHDKRFGVKFGKFKNVARRYFFLSDHKYLTFFMCGKGRRSELRLKEEFKIDSKTKKALLARVKLFPLNGIKEFTFLQIHSNANKSNGFNKPLLRVSYKALYRGKKQHIWATLLIKTKMGKRVYKKLDLGKIPKDFFDIKIKIGNNHIKIDIQNKTISQKLKSDDTASYYFKAGVYLQSSGCAKVEFEKLSRSIL